MRFITFQSPTRVGAGLIDGKHVLDLGLAYFRVFKRPFRFADVGDFLAQGALAQLPRLDRAKCFSDPKVILPRDGLILKAPIVRPPKIVCVGLNYRDHAEEQKAPIPERPLLFAKAANSVIGPDASIVLPAMSEKVDPEIELGVVIKDDCSRLSPQEAMDHVFGFTIILDVSARDCQYGDKQWYRGKSFRTFMPQGPLIVTPDELDCKALDLELRVNGEVRQKGTTANLIHGVPELVSYVSQVHDLEPGDLLATGTPAGVGVFRDPPVFLKPGDMLRATIQGIGTMENGVTADVGPRRH
ncbi:MAG: fumarylacetoacetate hydrolase family protein [Planctomycetes bacterium]|nr:fumarylacetoacetate hydrolase family protein [Planctomycetota bacterium]